MTLKVRRQFFESASAETSEFSEMFLPFSNWYHLSKLPLFCLELYLGEHHV